MAQKSKVAAIPFRPLARAPLPVTALPLPPGAGAETAVEMPSAIDLSGRRKAWFLIGRGRIGKTTFARWLVETMDQRGGSAVIAAADPVNRSLRMFLDNVAEPSTTEPDNVKNWLREMLEYAVQEKVSAIVDLGGGNTSLSALLAEMPNLADVLTDGGIEPVAVHVTGPDPHDLVTLAVTEAEGLRNTAVWPVRTRRNTVGYSSPK